MAKSLEDFIKSIKEFNNLKSSEMIDYFGFFYIEILRYEFFISKDISNAFKELRIEPYTNISQYLIKFSIKSKNQKFIKLKNGFIFIRNYDVELKSKIDQYETAFLDFKVDVESFDWKPADIHFLNKNERKNAHFFTKLYFLFYHLENSVRNFLKKRLIALLGNNWEEEILIKVDLNRAATIKKETDLSEMMEERGDNILHYCMWDDYGKIIKVYPNIFHSRQETDEISAHLSSMTKIRNGIAHNSSTVPKEYQDELTVFLKKYIKIVKKYL